MATWNLSRRWMVYSLYKIFWNGDKLRMVIKSNWYFFFSSMKAFWSNRLECSLVSFSICKRWVIVLKSLHLSRASVLDKIIYGPLKLVSVLIGTHCVTLLLKEASLVIWDFGLFILVISWVGEYGTIACEEGSM